MSTGANRFYNSIENAAALDDKQLIGLFAYYLTVEAGDDTVTAKSINACFIACDLKPPTRTAPHLTEAVADNKFVKAARGYKLQRHYREELSRMLGAEKIIAQTSVELRKLESRIGAGAAKEFLKETIDCFEARANRATIVMCWILTVDHLIGYVLKHHLTAFNAVLDRNTDRSVKVSSVSIRDDFSGIPEGKFIEFLKSANVISPDVRKILDEKLGIRNSSAHPSAIAIKPSKVIEFVDDLVENVVLKYVI